MNFWRSSKSGSRVAKTPKSLPSASGGSERLRRGSAATTPLRYAPCLQRPANTVRNQPKPRNKTMKSGNRRNAKTNDDEGANTQTTSADVKPDVDASVVPK